MKRSIRVFAGALFSALLGAAAVSIWPLPSLCQSTSKANPSEHCSDRIRFKKVEDFRWLAVDEKLGNIIRQLKFSRDDFDRMAFDQTEELASEAYGLGFLVSTKGDKVARRTKADLFKGVSKEVDDTLQKGDLSPSERTRAEAWASKLISLVSKSFDQGREDGTKPCPPQVPKKEVEKPSR
jgi:hypothetical protein